MIPPLCKVRQKIPAPELKDPSEELESRLKTLPLKLLSGKNIIIALPSRGICQMDKLTQVLVRWLKEKGANPAIVPAMGSHGASTSGGQKKVLQDLGISEENLSCPIKSEIEPKLVGELGEVKIYFDQFASQADGIILLNRIKPHTSFSGKYQSGLCKLLAVGLGKKQGAKEIHKYGPEKLSHLIPEVAGYLLKKFPVLFGVAVIENYRGRIARIEVLESREILEKEPELLAQAKELMPRLPFKELEVLVVDEIGKDISGTALDTNVIGRLDLRGVEEPDFPRVRRIVVLNLSKNSGGGYGIGLADITTKKVVEKLDLSAIRENALASGFVERARIPLWFDTDQQAIESAIQTCWCPNISQIRLARIKNTLQLEEFWATENLIPLAQVELEVLSPAQPLAFDPSGNLVR